MRVAILDDWCDTLRTLPSFEKLAGHDVTVLTEHIADASALATRIGGTQALVLFRERSAITEALLDRLPDLKLVAIRGATGPIDVPACTARGVAVAALPAGSTPPHATAELTLALILAALRRLPQNVESLQAGRWQEKVGRQLHGKRLGIWSYGRIGAAVARLAAAFGARVTVHGSQTALARAATDGFATQTDRTAFLAGQDIVSLHLRLSDRTRGIVGPKELDAMAPGALLVNTSRAGLVAPGALEAALDAGRLGGAALDVFETEPLTDPDHRLLMHPDVVATPHLGFVTLEELEAQFAGLFDLVNAFAAGSATHVVNPEVLPR